MYARTRTCTDKRRKKLSYLFHNEAGNGLSVGFEEVLALVPCEEFRESLHAPEMGTEGDANASPLDS